MKPIQKINYTDLQRAVDKLEIDTITRCFVADAIDELIAGAVTLEPLVEGGAGRASEYALWIIGIDPNAAHLVHVRTDGETPSEWTSAVAQGAAASLPAGLMPPDDDTLTQLSEHGTMTYALLVFIRGENGGVTVLYGLHLDADPEEASALMRIHIDLALECRANVN